MTGHRFNQIPSETSKADVRRETPRQTAERSVEKVSVTINRVFEHAKQASR